MKRKLVGWVIFTLVVVPFAAFYSAYVDQKGSMSTATLWVNRIIIIVQNLLLYYLLRWERRQTGTVRERQPRSNWLTRTLSRSRMIREAVNFVRRFIQWSRIKAVSLAEWVNYHLAKMHLKNVLVGNLFIGFLGSLYLRAAVSIVGLKREPIKFFPAIVIAVYLKGYTELYIGKALAITIRWFASLW